MSKEDDDQLSSGFPESLAQYNRQTGHYEAIETVYEKGSFSGENGGEKLSIHRLYLNLLFHANKELTNPDLLETLKLVGQESETDLLVGLANDEVFLQDIINDFRNRILPLIKSSSKILRMYFLEEMDVNEVDQRSSGLDYLVEEINYLLADPKNLYKVYRKAGIVTEHLAMINYQIITLNGHQPSDQFPRIIDGLTADLFLAWSMLGKELRQSTTA